MKISCSLQSLTLLLFVFAALSAQPVKLWETDVVFKAPESVAYDSIRDLLYVSNFTKNVKEGMMYGAHCISKIKPDGTLLKFDWIDNVTNPTGISVFADKLYIVERFGVVEYDLKNDSVSNRYRINSCCFLNDITVDKDTSIYVSVSDTNLIYRIKNGELEKWMESDKISKPNGILCHNGKMLIACNTDNYFKAIDMETLEVTNIAHLGPGILDGIKPCGDDYLVSHFLGNLYRVSLDGTVEELINTREQKSFIADFEYIETKELVIIPALWNNKIVGYHYPYEKNK